MKKLLIFFGCFLSLYCGFSQQSGAFKTFQLGDKVMNRISDDSALTQHSHVSLVTEYAVYHAIRNYLLSGGGSGVHDTLVIYVRDTTHAVKGIVVDTLLFPGYQTLILDSAYVDSTVRAIVGTITSGTESDPVWLADSLNYLKKSLAVTLYYPLSSNPAGYLTSASITGKKDNTDSVANSGYATVYSRNKARDSVQANVNANATTIAANTANILLKKDKTDSVANSGYATVYSRNKARDSVQANVDLKEPVQTGNGYVKKAGTTPSYVSAIPNADLANSQITINGTPVSLGGSITISGGGGSPGGRDTLVPVWNRRGVVMIGYPASEGMNNYEPSVIREGSPIILTNRMTVFKMWYTSGWIGKNTNYAESVDGITWVKYSGNPVVPNTSRSFVIKNGSTYVMYCSPNANNLTIDRYTSSNGVTWTLANAAVITSAANIYNTSVIIDGSTWRLLVDQYNGGSGYGQLYYTSPDGITWTIQNSGAPVLSGLGQGSTFLKKIGSTYYVWEGETGGVATLPTDIYRYSSPDMITWTKNMTTPALPRRQLDEGAQNSVGQVQDVYLLAVDSSVYIYYAASADGSDSAAGQRIKLAIANMPFDKLILTTEGDGADVILPQVFTRIDSSANAAFATGSLKIGSNLSPAASSLIDMASTTKGLLIPRMTTTQMSAITSPATGLQIFNTTTNTPQYYNGTGWINPATWSPTGNTGIDTSINFFGTTDAKSIPIRINNQSRGLFSYPLTSFILGATSTSMTTQAVFNNFVGWIGMTSLTSGSENNGMGHNVFSGLTTGTYNTGIGYSSLANVSTGSSNVGIGRNAGSGLTTTGGNVFIGYNPGITNTGSTNVAIGQSSLGGSGSGNSNVALGPNSLQGVSSGSNNIGLGSASGTNSTTASDQLFINNKSRADYLADKQGSFIYGVGNTNIFSQKSTLNGLWGVNNYNPSAQLSISPGTATVAPLIIGYTNLATTAATGTGTIVTLTFAAQTIEPFVVGSQIVVTGVTPSGYNGTWTVTAVTTTTVSYNTTATGTQTVAGSIIQGQLLTVPKVGGIEFDGDHFYGTDKTGTRKQLDN